MRIPPETGEADVTAQRILDLVARGEARSRSELASALSLAPSTVGLRVQSLVDAGLLRESGAGASSGRRRRVAIAAAPAARGCCRGPRA